ncbi:RAMP superfamily CRISPR-associated protein [Vallitalea guaymasensis]|uniref:RAMP superfamily CRISPR-associated protein n=1 Tax=Vallitalea guaymasensis TaxID=1185412 RepID=UPI0023554DBA|nr:RAMP superfamily CRISPR-associated protein [Vallitalea guaymasensis]
MRYIIKVTLESEAVFNSGEEDKNLVNEKVLCDEEGFVYLHAKTFKGILRQRGKWVFDKLIKINKEFDDNAIDRMFGTEGNPILDTDTEYVGSTTSMLQIGNLELDSDIKEVFRLSNRLKDDIDYKITPYELVQAQTNTRTKIKIDETGVVQEHRTMAYHTVKKDLEFYSHVNLNVNSDEEIKKYELLLALIVKNIDKIGGSVNRGRGQVKAELLYENKQKVKLDKHEGEGILWKKTINI